MSHVELYGTRSCPYTAELRFSLEWDGTEFVEYDVESDASAMGRLAALCPGASSVPVLVDEGRVVQVGYQGRSCYVKTRMQ